MNQVRRYFKKAKIYSYIEVVVRITDDIPLLNWIPHFAKRFLNKMRTGRGCKESIAQFGEEELTSFVKRTIQGVFVCHYDRTRTIVHLTRCGIVRRRSWTRQILSDAWEPFAHSDRGNKIGSRRSAKNVGQGTFGSSV